MVSGRRSPNVSLKMARMLPSPTWPDGRRAVKLVEAAGRNAVAVICDVSKENSVAAMAKAGTGKIRPRRHRGELRRIYPQRDFAEMTFADWRIVLSINLDGTFLVTAAFVPGMRARKWGASSIWHRARSAR